jgi:hypothetical protein
MRLAGTIGSLLFIAGCQGTFGDASTTGSTPDDGTVNGMPIACPIDPDCHIGGDCSLYECPDYWLCEDLATGNKRCTNPGPDYPDQGGDWECEDVGAQTVCRGSDFPDGGGGGDWNCERSGEFVVCTSDTPDYPDAGGGGAWNCWFEGEFRVCESGGGDGGEWECYDTPSGRECRRRTPDYPDDRDWDCHDASGTTVCSAPGDFPDGGSGGDWNCERMAELIVCTDDTPDYPDDGGGGAWDCYYTDEFRVCEDGGDDYPDDGGAECVAGAQRWCDDHVYCSWGKQTCLPDGRWGPCIEPTLTRDGLTDRPDTSCGCRYFYFNDACCEDQTDRDGDGNPDCIIPAGHTAPTCASDGSLCSYCDVHTDCGGASDMCLFGRDGYAFCSRDCSSAPCPSGYSCQTIGSSTGTLYQCAPTAADRCGT